MRKFGVYKKVREKIRQRQIPGANPPETDEVDITEYIDWDPPRKAEARLRAGPYDPSALRVVNPVPAGPFLQCRGRRPPGGPPG
jgi:hypothetical protein